MTDIDHNRQGQLSPGQAALLADAWRTTEPRGPFLLWFCYAFLAFVVAACLIERAWLAAVVFGPIAAILAAVLTRAFRETRTNRPPPPPPGVVAVDGSVVWGRTGVRRDLLPSSGVYFPEQGWVPVREDGSLVIRQLCVLPLPPGPYRFYLCGDTIVGAESRRDARAWWSTCQGQHSPGPFRLTYRTGAPPAPFPIGDPAALFRVVSEALGFDESDLAHNRRGSLSPRQGAGTVLTIEGLLEGYWEWPMTENRFGGPLRAWWIVGGRTIVAPVAPFWAVPPGLAYRMFLDPRSERVVSLEPVPHAQPGPHA
jgi:hypothetical protein